MAGGINIKLAVDTKRNRVLFAEAGSDFVDVLLSFLTLPLSAVQLVAGASSPGCLSSLRQGVSNLSESNLLRFDACHGMLLRPRHEDEFRDILGPCSCCAATVRSLPSLQGNGSKCRCWQVMARAAHLFNQTQSGNGETFVKAKRRFVISDDLVIKPASTASTRLLLQRLGSGTTVDAFEEIEVRIGWAEVVSMLKAACFPSKSVFTDTFVLKETNRCVRRTAVNSSTRQDTVNPSVEETDSSPQFNIKVFYDRHERKVMYAECEHGFVDLLLSFLIYPVACVIKNLAGTSYLSCSLDNLYCSALDLHANGLLSEQHGLLILSRRSNTTEALLDPSITPFVVSPPARALKEWFFLCRAPGCGCRIDGSKKTCFLCSPQFVIDGAYAVDDNLLIYQASAIAVMKHWRGNDKVLEMDMAITKQEAVALLRAALAGETALTDVFRSRLEGKCPQLLPSPLQPKHFQIFVRLPTGNTIVLDVEDHDTIAAVKRKIDEKARLQLPEGCRLMYGIGINHSVPDSSTISDCNIVHGSTIQCAVYKGAPAGN